MAYLSHQYRIDGLKLALSMDFQTITVAVLVGLSFAYATQALLPLAWRMRAMHAMARWPLPHPLRDRLAQRAQKISTCGCDGCDRSTAQLPGATGALSPTEAKIIFMRRPGP